MERGSFNSCFDKAQGKLAEHAGWVKQWEQEATLGCPKGQRSRFEGSPVAFISLRRRYRAANRLRWCACAGARLGDLKSRHWGLDSVNAPALLARAQSD